ncbi:FHA domain-containing protein [Mycetocola saprophilus]|uniref:FHA domain-containing protein n=1 Tax=Mycetocola saprophilus TaxID=76636 RepID=UPI00068E2F35|nr:FHA domain-containing protein [Mycetocola saprophilus]
MSYPGFAPIPPGSDHGQVPPPLPPVPDQWVPQPGFEPVAPDEGTVMITPIVEPAEPEYDPELDGATVVVDRTPPRAWFLVLAEGGEVELPGDDVVLGRNPHGDGVQPAVRVPDAGKTISKTHARLRRVENDWFVTDLGSTNGVLFFSPEGQELLLPSGVETLIQGDFILGTVRVLIESRDGTPAVRTWGAN